MKSNRLLIVLLIAALMLACNAPLAPAAQETQKPVASETQQSTTPATETPKPLETATETLTPLPSQTPTITPTSTPSVPMATPLKDDVNCRFGPSTTYEQIAALLVGAYAQILAKSINGAWWQVQNPSGGSEKCWVSASVVVVSGDQGGIPAVAAPAAYITDIKLQVKPNSINLGVGCPGPAPVFSLKGIIHVNGPLEIKWHFETQKDGSLPGNTLSAPKFGDYNVSYDYMPTVWGKGSYWVRLVITSPSSMFEEAKYEIKCS
jgi:hypothetical protein